MAQLQTRPVRRWQRLKPAPDPVASTKGYIGEIETSRQIGSMCHSGRVSGARALAT